MKLTKLLSELEIVKLEIEACGGDPNNSEVVIYSDLLKTYTADFDYSVDDNNDISLNVIAGAKSF